MKLMYFKKESKNAPSSDEQVLKDNKNGRPAWMSIQFSIDRITITEYMLQKTAENLCLGQQRLYSLEDILSRLQEITSVF